MKIGIDARFWNETGVGRYIRNLVAQLQIIDKTNQYVLFVNQKDDINLKSENWKLIPVDIHWHSIREQIEFPKLLQKENLDLMHFPYFSIPIFYNKPFVVTIHDLILHHFATGEATTKSKLIYKGKLLSYKFIIKTAAQKAEKIIAVSQATKHEIVDHLHVPAEKIEVSYEGIDAKITSEARKPTSEIQNYFLHVGNLYPHKNSELLLHAFQALKDQNNPVKLVIVGRTDFFLKRFKLQVKQKQLEEQILFLGEVSDAELSYLYQHAQALITSSLMEGFDLPAAEAMANDCLVLASDIPVHREICQDAGIYFQSNNLRDLVLQLNQISQNGKKDYKKNREAGLALVREYSWEKMAKQTKKIYEDCVSLR
jgi:glycosyltransferase involved in cell wall biosynthesis